MKTIIVDDERLARNELKRLLKSFPEIEVIGEAMNAQEALERIENLLPDLLFLDIQMPGKNGLELLEALNHLPLVIFTMAFDEYAVKAFDVNALDYLLKPIEPRRLSAAIEKIFNLNRKINLQQRQSPLGNRNQIFVKDGERCWFVKLGAIRLLESEGNYTRIYFEHNKPLVLYSLNYLEERLDSNIFFRASRKHIINLLWVEGLELSFDSRLIVRIKNCPEIEMSRRCSQKFREKTSL